ncbi:hypothetical protein [Pseudoalteromonas sp. BSi20439]|uniref:hypothetical protein n=1 Tax=Pseudoalteromonas sp. BSi20439 TaxID=420915 RepID=UPI00023198EA|nr:hypothetical protein [Pseudoalteromonas sp. BSi20439]GAA72417.1 hypothetical protein P20439_2506 [Pseudoalteromonas sp. BSi20439]
MKYLIFTLALISAFFVSAEPDMSDLVSPKQVSTGTCGLVTDINSIINDSDGDSCVQYIRGLIESDSSYKRIDNVWLDGEAVMFTGKTSYETTFRVGIFRVNSSTPTCPPDSHPNYIISVGEGSSLMCAKEFVPPPQPDPDAKCDEFGNNSMLPPKDGVGTPGQTACYTNPTTGKSCQYSQGHDNFTATGKDCDGDENDYGDKPTPQPPPDGNDDNCYDYGSLGGVLICDVDPNQGCNALLINGQTQYQCPPGCGSMDGVYFCTYDDLDGDGKADDKNGNGVPDKDETCVNGRCTPNPDPNETPNPDAPDMTQTNNKLDGIKGELGFVGGKLDKTNQALDGINSGIQGLKKSQDKSNGLLTDVEKNTKLTAGNTDAISGNTKGILDTLSETDVGNTFNPDASLSFYESSYENGFSGVWEEKSTAFKQTETFQFLEQFKFNAGGSAPDTQMCFNLGGSMDFGCAELPTPSPQLLAIIRVFILITAAFLCRALIFGG